MGLAANIAGGDRIEGTHQAYSGQEALGSKARALITRLLGHGAIATGNGIAGIQHHLAGHLGGIVAADLRGGTVGHGEQDHLAEGRRLARRASAGPGAQLGGQGLQGLGVTRRNQHLMPGVDPEPGQRGTDIAGADDADLHCLAPFLGGAGHP
ncbi:hypothetical protein D3C81_1405930 [compost metagenome]